jgi:hypothetical protein
LDLELYLQDLLVLVLCSLRLLRLWVLLGQLHQLRQLRLLWKVLLRQLRLLGL